MFSTSALFDVWNLTFFYGQTGLYNFNLYHLINCVKTGTDINNTASSSTSHCLVAKFNQFQGVIKQTKLNSKVSTHQYQFPLLESHSLLASFSWTTEKQFLTSQSNYRLETYLVHRLAAVSVLFLLAVVVTAEEVRINVVCMAWCLQTSKLLILCLQTQFAVRLCGEETQGLEFSEYTLNIYMQISCVH